jgi:DNA polymerase III subunit delta'
MLQLQEVENFFGNQEVRDVLEQMIRGSRIPGTMLFSGPAGIGKATLARRFAARLLGDAHKIEQDDLSLPAQQAMLAEREKWPADKRNNDPLLLASHPDFVTFPPDGPLRQISIQQMRLLKDRAQLKPLRGQWRIFLIDGIDRAFEQSANALLKTLEEPPSHLILIMTAQNSYDLLPTIRSRAVQFQLTPLNEEEMRAFVQARRLPDPERRMALASGSPGMAVVLDLEAYDRRRGAMLKLLEVGAGQAAFAEWMKHSEYISARKTEKLEYYLDVLYLLLEDVLVLQQGGAKVRNPDIHGALTNIAGRVSFEWIRAAVKRVDELAELLRRNIQKGIALDAFALELRSVS